MLTKSTALAASLFGAILVSAAVAMADESKTSHVDDLLVKAQKICPVTGKDLQAMGGPVKAEVGGATVFLCCKGCFGKPLDKTHWSTVRSNVAAAQAKCPIFKKPLGEHPVAVVVDKRMLFVCCPPCTAKVKADPATAIAFVDKQIAETFKVEK